MERHRPRRTGLDAEFAGETFFVLEEHPHCFSFDLEGAGRANSDAGAAVGAAVFVADNVASQRLDANAGILKVFEAAVVIVRVAGKFDDHDTLRFLVDGSLEDIKVQVIVFNEAAYDWPIDRALGEVEHHFFRYCHLITFPIAISS